MIAAFDPSLAYAESLDDADPLRWLRDEFVVDDEQLVYLDGNSLGRLPRATEARLRDLVTREWGGELVRGWHHWLDMPTRVGDLVGERLLGAAPGQVVVCDTTTVNLYKLADAALTLVGAAPDGRRVIITDDDNFPTDRYVLDGIAKARGLEIRLVRADPVSGLDLSALAAAVDDTVALVSLSHVAYGSGALLDMAAVNRIVHDAGALMLWDLCHAVGSVPIALDADGADLAVGCTYKYLNAGPGAPAFLYARRELRDRLDQPIHGWMSAADPFEMGPNYRPAPAMSRFLTGTPNVLGTAAVEEGARLLVRAGIDALRVKGQALTSYLIELADAWLVPLGFTLASPRDPAARGSHVSLAHPEAYRISRALIERAGVVPDYRGPGSSPGRDSRGPGSSPGRDSRGPDRLRLGPAPATTGFADVHTAMDRIRHIVETRAYTQYDAGRSRVT